MDPPSRGIPAKGQTEGTPRRARHEADARPGLPPAVRGKTERWHRTTKAVVKLANDFPWRLAQAIGDFVAYYDSERPQESLDNVVPADLYYGRAAEVISERGKTERERMKRRTKEWRAAIAA